MYTKIHITGNVEVITGLHIGGANEIAAIGTVDSPVSRDVRTNLPMIPGSSLKGKMRSLLAKEYNTDNIAHDPNDDAECLTRLFGFSRNNKESISRRGRLLIADMFLKNEEELRRQGIQSLTEIKFENTIDRTTGKANPRQIERVIRGSFFGMDIIYELEELWQNEFFEDMETLAEGLRLIQYDYLGGNGTRGYGKVLFRDLKAETVVGKVDEERMKKCNEILRKIGG